MKRTKILLLLSLGYLCLGCEKSIRISPHAEAPMDYSGLKQVVAFQEGLISGSKPTGHKGFNSLMKMGVRTIICVDGVAPDVKTAKRYGIKTIHIPLKYVAPSQEQIFDLTTVVVREKEKGNIYIHCHQGKHRSAVAAAVVSIALGNLSVIEAKKRMRVSQTSEAYEGLWNAVELTTKMDVNALLQNQKIYPSSVEPKGITNQMIAIDEAVDNLLRIQHANWRTPKDHPDLVGAAEVGQIADIFRNIQLSPEANNISSDFETQLVNAIHQANGLEEALLQQLPTIELDVYLRRVEQSCINCHSAFRK